MPKSSFIDFKAVKAAITMEQVLQHYGLIDRFKRAGNNLSGPCPIHKGSNPTQFRVSLVKNIWNCFSQCKSGGNVLDFIAKMEDLSVHAAALKAIEWFSLELETTTASSATHMQVPNKTSKIDTSSPLERLPVDLGPVTETSSSNKPLKFRLEKLEREHPYLAERGLTMETLTDFGVGYCTKGMMAGRIAIPIRNAEGNVVAYAGRFPGDPPVDTPKYKLPPGFRKSLELFNIDRAIKETEDTPLLIVEGFFDCMKLWQHGIKRVVALMGSSLSAVQEDLIRKHTDPNSQIIVMLDEDKAGQEGRENIAVRLAKFAFAKIHIFEKPDTQPDQMTGEEIQKIQKVFGGKL